jgi:hypothetical protein
MKLLSQPKFLSQPKPPENFTFTFAKCKCKLPVRAAVNVSRSKKQGLITEMGVVCLRYFNGQWRIGFVRRGAQPYYLPGNFEHFICAVYPMSNELFNLKCVRVHTEKEWNEKRLGKNIHGDAEKTEDKGFLVSLPDESTKSRLVYYANNISVNLSLIWKPGVVQTL